MRLVAVLAVTALGCTHASAPAPVPTAAAVPGATRAPCSLGKRPLEASWIYRQVEGHIRDHVEGEDVRPVRLGSCVFDGTILSEYGPNYSRVVVAEIGCGVRILRPGVLDHAGFEVGVTGAEVIERRSGEGQMRCRANGPDHARCWFQPSESNGSESNPSEYVVAGTVGDEDLVGDRAIGFFSIRTVTEMLANVWCH
jgi:hypothetical protein